MADIFHTVKNHPFESKAKVLAFYDEGKETNRKVLKALVIESLNDVQKEIGGHLNRLIKTIDAKELALFLQFTTGAHMLPVNGIKVVFTKDEPRMSRARTCVPQLKLQENYRCYNE